MRFSWRKSIEEMEFAIAHDCFFKKIFLSIFIEVIEHFLIINLMKNLYQDNTSVLISFLAKIDHLIQPKEYICTK